MDAVDAKIKKDFSLTQRLNIFSSNAGLEALKEESLRKQEPLDVAINELSQLDVAISAKKAEIKAVEADIAGVPKTTLDSVKTSVSTIASSIAGSVASIKDKVSLEKAKGIVHAKVDNIMRAMALFLLQTLLLPLLFFYMFSKGLGLAWGVDISGMLARRRSDAIAG